MEPWITGAPVCLPAEQVLLERLPAQLVIVVFQTGLGIAPGLVDDRSAGDNARDEQRPGVQREHGGKALDRSSDLHDLGREAVRGEDASRQHRALRKLHQPVGVVFQESDKIAQMAHPRPGLH